MHPSPFLAAANQLSSDPENASRSSNTMAGW
jgi:hypothetical protein